MGWHLSPTAKKMWFSIHLRHFGSHMPVNIRLTVHLCVHPCLVPWPHYYAWPMRFRSRGPCLLDMSAKCIDREGLERCRTGTRQRPPISLHHRATNVKFRTFKPVLEPAIWYCTSMSWSIIESCQNRVSADPVSHEDITGSGIKPSRLRVFLKIFPD